MKQKKEKKFMLTFVISTTTNNSNLALFENDKMLVNQTLNVKKTHSILIQQQVEMIFKWADKKISDVDTVVISKGPGSFTGVRIAMALIKGMFCLSENVKIYSVKELDAIYYANKGIAEYIVCGIDSRKGKIYHSIYENGIKIVDDSIANIYTLISENQKIDKSICYAGDIYHNYILAIDHPKLVKPNVFCTVADARVYYDMYKNGLATLENILDIEPYYLEKSQAENDMLKRKEE